MLTNGSINDEASKKGSFPSRNHVKPFSLQYKNRLTFYLYKRIIFNEKPKGQFKVSSTKAKQNSIIVGMKITVSCFHRGHLSAFINATRHEIKNTISTKILNIKILWQLYVSCFYGQEVVRNYSLVFDSYD
ncbi:hypothetical protein A3752_17210 [Oleiphilus sp. HI0081]|nr:hypothetical protein A3740_20405 [Oleiphilus sp. HI0068]KZY93662.1 hypothetical protein A3743_06105 [Oleiphilus sp. HI0072]KZZ11667.1 hypothetical protein A3749_08440 [Oleiphilus sp. HI0078]KZZ18199.1 hypothetical protein A3752_17210 [Oleiphilus sp. HI0081]KZZ38020.1 hypothetical protein A3757_09085 [Oleiphilus sp. HI0117]KZZ71667.1 hypothetical protein A3766_08080 [Oleiphilus sp. HI0132]